MCRSDLKIFIVDDNYSAAELLYEFLKGYGFENTEYFTNPIEAYSTICNKNMHYKNIVVLSDQNMPKIKGEDLLYHLQSVITVNAAIITSDPKCVTSNKYRIFDKGTINFFREIIKYLEDLSREI